MKLTNCNGHIDHINTHRFVNDGFGGRAAKRSGCCCRAKFFFGLGLGSLFFGVVVVGDATVDADGDGASLPERTGCNIIIFSFFDNFFFGVLLIDDVRI